MDTFNPNASINALDAPGYTRLLERLLDRRGWPQGSAATVAALYDASVRVSTELAWHEWIADYSMTCGARRLAAAAAKRPAASRSPVYLAYVAQAPARPLYGIGGRSAPPAHFASHCWDYMAAARGWTLFHEWSAGQSPVYAPTTADVALGDLMRGHWAELTRTGRIEGLADYTKSDTTTVYSHGTVYGAHEYAGHRCDVLEASPLVMGRTFWCVN